MAEPGRLPPQDRPPHTGERPPGSPTTATGGDAAGTAADPRPSPAALVGTVVWRGAIGALAVHYAATGREETMSSESLSYLSNVGAGWAFLTLAVYPILVLGRRTEPVTAWLRGAVTIMMLVVGLVFVVGMGEDPDGPHAVIPLLILSDWLLVGRSQFRTRTWEPPTWTALLLLYLWYHQSNDLTLYPDILGEENIGTVVPLMLVGTVIVAYLLHGATRLRRNLVTRRE